MRFSTCSLSLVLALLTSSAGCNIEDTVEGQAGANTTQVSLPDAAGSPDAGGVATVQPDLALAPPEDMALDADMKEEPPIACKRTDDCPATHHCLIAVGAACDAAGLAMGVCTPKPTSCPMDAEPVCGCNGQTYVSACSAALLGQDLRTVEACPDACDPSECTATPAQETCPDGSAQQSICARPTRTAACRWELQSCPDLVRCTTKEECREGEVCGKMDEAVHGCDLSQDRHCYTPPAASCPKDLPQVCGCDGLTYGSACLAIKAGALISKDGPCPCDADATCEGKQYCATASSSNVCPSPGSPGECRDKEFCFSIPSSKGQACGCDGTTYDSSCAAQMASVAVASKGLCPGHCIAPSDCASNEYCDFVSNCGRDAKSILRRIPGLCKARPVLCRFPITPLTACGCDDNTYESACMAARAGTDVRVEHKGVALCAVSSK